MPTIAPIPVTYSVTARVRQESCRTEDTVRGLSGTGGYHHKGKRTHPWTDSILNIVANVRMHPRDAQLQIVVTARSANLDPNVHPEI